MKKIHGIVEAQRRNDRICRLCRSIIDSPEGDLSTAGVKLLVVVLIKCPLTFLLRYLRACKVSTSFTPTIRNVNLWASVSNS